MKKLSAAFFSAVILFIVASFVGTSVNDVPSETGFVDQDWSIKTQ